MGTRKNNYASYDEINSHKILKQLKICYKMKCHNLSGNDKARDCEKPDCRAAWLTLGIFKKEVLNLVLSKKFDSSNKY